MGLGQMMGEFRFCVLIQHPSAIGLYAMLPGFGARIEMSHACTVWYLVEPIGCGYWLDFYRIKENAISIAHLCL